MSTGKQGDIGTAAAHETAAPECGSGQVDGGGIAAKSLYPQHDRLSAISDQSQAIGEFVEEFLPRKNLAISYEKGSRRYGCVAPSIRTLLAEFFDIDQDAIEAERRAMLDALREANATTAPSSETAS